MKKPLYEEIKRMNQPLDIYYEKCPVMYISDTGIVFLKFVVIVAYVARFLSIIQNLVIAYLLLYDNGTKH